MKSILSLLCLTVLAVFTSTTQPAYSEGAKPNVSPADLAVDCVHALVASRIARAVSSDVEVFSLEPPSLFFGDDKREVKIFRLKATRQSDHRIIGVIERGPEPDVEIPRIAAICLNEVEHPSPSGKKGEIDFKSGKGETISMRFILHKNSTNPGDLRYTSWKASGNDSVWMAGPFAPNARHDPPTAKDWPLCMPSKTQVPVKLSGNEISFQFDGCTNPGSADLQYEYALHMEQVSGGATVDVIIDPLIINHPP
jgi:hypothetical protein